MKKKGIIISLTGILLISILLVILVSKNNKKYVMYDGVMLAMTKDGEYIKEVPSDKNYTVDVVCENAKGRWDAESWSFYVEEITGNVICNLSFTTRTDSDKLSSVVQTNATTNLNGYRYSGQTPSNYVWFNNELWRIIGLIPACTAQSSLTCSETTDLVKIIRDQSIGGISYNSRGGSNVYYVSGSLKNLLNFVYYGKSMDYSTTYCTGYGSYVGVCDYREIGISSSAADYYNQMIKPVYWYIGIPTTTSSGTTMSTTYAEEMAMVLPSLDVKVGLMSISDYGYSSGTDAALSTAASAVNKSWMASYGNGWTISGFALNNSIIEITAHDYKDGLAIRPVVYLKENIYVISGTGTAADPYIIGMYE